jgi:hypothetical protein
MIRHLPGKSNQAADAVSQYPIASGSVNTVHVSQPSSPDIVAHCILASIQSDTTKVTAVSWSNLEGHTLDNPSLNKLLQFVESGVPIDYKVHPDLRPYSSVCDSLYSHDGVILYQDRVVVPSLLQNKVVQNLHSAHH